MNIRFQVSVINMEYQKARQNTNFLPMALKLKPSADLAFRTT